MTTKDFQTKRPLAIFLSYFRPHRRLFALDIICAFMISLVDLAFPLISRTAMYQWLPQQQYRTFFIVMGIVVLAFVLRALSKEDLALIPGGRRVARLMDKLGGKKA